MGKVTVIYRKNPLLPSERSIVEESSGVTFRQLLGNAGAHDRITVSCNGKRVTDLDQETKPGDSVVISAKPKAEAVAAVIAVVQFLAAPAVTAWGAFTATTFGAWLVGSALGQFVMGSIVAFGLGQIIQLFTPTPALDAGSGDFEDSQTYSWNPTNNAMSEGRAVPVLYGTHLVTPPCIARNVSLDAQGRQVLNLLLAVGEGPIDIGEDEYARPDIRIDDTNLANFDTVVFPPEQTAVLAMPSVAFGTSYYTTGYGSYPYWNVLSVNPSRYWWAATSDASPCWMCDFGAGRSPIVTHLRINTVFAPFTIYGSNDLSIVSDPPNAPSADWNEIGTFDFGYEGPSKSGTFHGSLEEYQDALANGLQLPAANIAPYRFLKFAPSKNAVPGFRGLYSLSLYGAEEINQYDPRTNIYRQGVNDQLPLSKFQQTWTQEAVSARLTLDYITRTIPGNDVDSIGIGLAFPNGLYRLDSDGDVLSTSVTVAAQYRLSGAAEWEDWATWVISDTTQEAKRVVHHLDVVRGQYEVRIHLAEQPKSSMYYSNRVYLEYIEGAYNNPLSYPNTAVLGLSIVASDQLSGADPRITVMASRQALPVYDPEDPEADADGFVYQPSDNPAWAAYDMLTNSRYGGGVDYSQILLDDFKAWATICDNRLGYAVWQTEGVYQVGDVVVPSRARGYAYRATAAGAAGADEPSWPESVGDETTDGTVTWECVLNGHRLNIYFDSAQVLGQSLGYIGTIGRGTVVQRGTKYGVLIDCPASPVQLFCEANISGFSEEFLGDSDLVNGIEVTYFDREADFSRQVVEARSSGFDDDPATNHTSQVTLYGCTDRTQAYQYARFLLECNTRIRRTVSFSADIDAIACEIGDVIRVAHVGARWGTGGRLLSATADSATLDQPVSMLAGIQYQLVVRHADDTISTVQIALPGEDLTTPLLTLADGESWNGSTPAAGDVFVFGTETGSARLFRVIRITRDGDQMRKITAVQYDPLVYTDALEDITHELTYEQQESGVQGLAAKASRADGLLILNATWSGTALRWRVTVSNADTRVQIAEASVGSGSFSCQIPCAGRYTVSVFSDYPKDFETVEVSFLAAARQSFDLLCDKTYADIPAATQRVAVGLHDSHCFDRSANVAYQPYESITIGAGRAPTTLATYGDFRLGAVYDVGAETIEESWSEQYHAWGGFQPYYLTVTADPSKTPTAVTLRWNRDELPPGLEGLSLIYAFDNTSPVPAELRGSNPWVDMASVSEISIDPADLPVTFIVRPRPASRDETTLAAAPPPGAATDWLVPVDAIPQNLDLAAAIEDITGGDYTVTGILAYDPEHGAESTYAYLYPAVGMVLVVAKTGTTSGGQIPVPCWTPTAEERNLALPPGQIWFGIPSGPGGDITTAMLQAAGLADLAYYNTWSGDQIDPGTVPTPENWFAVSANNPTGKVLILSLFGDPGARAPQRANPYAPGGGRSVDPATIRAADRVHTHAATDIIDLPSGDSRTSMY